jgi:hypothetical protein
MGIAEDDIKHRVPVEDVEFLGSARQVVGEVWNIQVRCPAPTKNLHSNFNCKYLYCSRKPCYQLIV